MSAEAAGPRVGAGAARRRTSSPEAAAAGGAGRERQMVLQRSHDGAGLVNKMSLSSAAPPAARPGPGRGSPSVLPSMPRRRAELLRLRGAGGNRNPQSLSVSCASEASNGSFCSRASTGRIGRPTGTHGGAARQRVTGSAAPPSSRPVPRKKAASVVPDGGAAAAAVVVAGSPNGEEAASAAPARCPWVTPNTDPCYADFHDQEWGVPVHDDKKLFEMLVLSGALAEMAWPVILSKRDTFRQVFMDFDPALVSKINEKKFLGPCSPPCSLLADHRLLTIIENAREILKVIEEFGSLDEYLWGFLKRKPMVGRFRSPREVPLRTPKAEAVSHDMMRRGLRGVGPTVVYAFMQAVGMANDHLVTCYRFQQCSHEAEASASGGHGEKTVVKGKEAASMVVCGLIECAGLDASRAAAAMISIS